MNPQPIDQRNKNRILRNAKDAERILFTMIEELQNTTPGSAEEWKGVFDLLERIEERINVCGELVTAVMRERHQNDS